MMRGPEGKLDNYGRTGAIGMAAAERDSFRVLLRRLRLRAGLTQEALAERAGISAKAVSDLERGLGRTPRLTTVTLLTDALGLNPDERAGLLASARPNHASGTDAVSSASPGSAMPRPLTPLFGRAGVVEAVAELVRRADRPDAVRLVVLTGPGGVGKTRLAIAVAERAASMFADGVVFVDLAPLRDPTLVLTTIARRLSIDERDRVALRDRMAAALRRKHLLLLLDNLEHLVAARDDVLALLEACPLLERVMDFRSAGGPPCEA